MILRTMAVLLLAAVTAMASSTTTTQPSTADSTKPQLPTPAALLSELKQSGGVGAGGPRVAYINLDQPLTEK
ncbi:MAG TPA: hypothetical protein VL992_12940, partial [Tepidisphaeraceae bacterium]|nr:hypothetical protein [Tepidisphaeraceae bacterium]